MFVSAQATILHADLDAFFASVEQRDDPRLRGRPVIVGGGVVLAASYEAKALRRPDGDGRPAGAAALPAGGRRAAADVGVLRGEQGASSRSSRTRRRSSRGSRSTRRSSTSAGCERIAGTPGRDRRAAAARRSRERVGLPITVGVARTKFLAKVASARGQARRPARRARRTRELAFLHPLPVERLWGVGPVTAAKLHRRGITTVGQVAGFPETALVTLLGRAAGRHLHALAHNRDPRPVEPAPPAAVDRRAARARAPAADGRARSTPILVGLVDRVDAADADGRPRRAAPSSCGCASTTSRARRARTRCRGATAETAGDPRRRARAARGARPG